MMEWVNFNGDLNKQNEELKAELNKVRKGFLVVSKSALNLESKLKSENKALRDTLKKVRGELNEIERREVSDSVLDRIEISIDLINMGLAE